MSGLRIKAIPSTLGGLVTHMRTPLFRNAYALMLSAGGSAVLGLLYWIIAARLYKLETVGQNAALIATMLLISSLSQLEMANVLVRFIPTASRKTRRLVVSAYLCAAIVGAVISVAIGSSLGASLFHLEFLSHSNGHLISFTLAVAGWGIFALQDSVLIGLRQAIWVPIENIVYGAMKLILLILFAAPFPEFGIFAAWTIPALFLLLPVNTLIFGRLIPRHMAETPRLEANLTLMNIFRYTSGDFGGTLFSTLYVRGLPLLVLRIAGAAANAYFYTAWSLAFPLQLIASSLASSLVVETVTDTAQAEAYLYRTLRLSLLLLTPTVAIMIVAAPFALQLSGGGYAAEGIWTLRLVALATLPNMVTTLFFSISRISRRTLRIAFIEALLCAGVLGLSYVLLPHYGVSGVGIAWLASQTIVALGIVATRPYRLVRLLHVWREPWIK